MFIFKNFNLYWAATTLLASWFLFLHTPPFWKKRHLLQIGDFTLAIHILTASILYLACIHNCLITPSIARSGHVWIGRIGLVSGFVSFPLGAYIAWSRLTLDESSKAQGSTTLGFALPITIGGILQIVCEIKGYQAIRQYQAVKEQPNPNATTPHIDPNEALRKHIAWMLSLFVFACSIPAGIRLAACIAGQEEGILPFVLILLIIAVLQLLATRYKDIMCPPAQPTRLQCTNSTTSSYHSISTG